VIAVQKNELDKLNSKMLLLEKENIEMKQQVSNLIDSMKVLIPKAVVDATQPVLLKLTTQQTFFEKQTELILNTLQEQMTMYTNMPTSKSSSVSRCTKKTHSAPTGKTLQMSNQTHAAEVPLDCVLDP